MDYVRLITPFDPGTGFMEPEEDEALDASGRFEEVFNKSLDENQEVKEWVSEESFGTVEGID